MLDVLLSSVLALAAAARGGLIVEEVQKGYAAHQAGLKPGDILTGWERAASPPANPEPARGVFESPFDLEEVEREQAARGEVSLFGTRDGQPLRVRLPPGRWRLQARPGLDTDARRASWLLLSAARAAAEKKAWEAADAAFAQAVQGAEADGDTAVVAIVQASWGSAFQSRGLWDRAESAYRSALTAHRALSAASIGEAWMLDNLARVSITRGDLAAAEEQYRHALAIREKLAPDSLEVADSFNGLGIVARARGDLATAEDHHRRTLAIRESLAPQGAGVAASLSNLGAVARQRGDLAAAEDSHARALAIWERLEPQGARMAATLNNMGNVASDREDLAAAEAYYLRSLAIKERTAPGSLDVATSLNNLGYAAMQRGALAVAEEYYLRSLAIREKIAPHHPHHDTRQNLGHLALLRGDLRTAADHFERDLAVRERNDPRSLGTAESVGLLGDVALVRRDLPTAESHYQRALGITQERAPGSAAEAASFRRLARLDLQRGRREAASASYGRALEALDAQWGRLGGTDETRSRFSAQYAAYYRESLRLLLELNRPAEAFHVLERYRARGFLSLLAERDLVFSADIPEELDRQWRMANAAYDAALARLGTAKGDAVKDIREALDTVRRRQAEIQARIRAASPRLGALQRPEPLNLAATRKALDAGTLLLSYSIGDEASYLFAVGPGPDDFAAVALDVELETLRTEVGRFRQLLQHAGQLRRKQLQLASQRLSALLLDPVAPRIQQAERLLILPDGPLHLIPFAALTDPTVSRRHRFLVEAKPVHLAASATVFAELKKDRRAQRPARLVAFGDPDYSASLGKGAAPRPLPARRRGLDLVPLPATRKEVEGLRRLYPDAQTFVGAEATEERAKTVGEQASLLHFACHALADEASPLDSALVFSLPTQRQPGRDNGLLQAWEILEQMRIDADLVTLSACGTALGKEMSGEGILGLTRAFQYAGARSVLASLWEVSDDSTADLMRHFYGHLKQGRSKDEALRAAQMEMIRRAASSSPYRWAAFQIIGDR